MESQKVFTILVKMLAMVSVEDYTIVGVGNDMKEALREIETAFAGVRITENDAASTAEEDGTVVISGGPMVEYDQATLTAISESVAKIRNQYAK